MTGAVDTSADSNRSGPSDSETPILLTSNPTSSMEVESYLDSTISSYVL